MFPKSLPVVWPLKLSVAGYWQVFNTAHPSTLPIKTLHFTSFYDIAQTTLPIKTPLGFSTYLVSYQEKIKCISRFATSINRYNSAPENYNIFKKYERKAVTAL